MVIMIVYIKTSRDSLHKNLPTLMPSPSMRFIYINVRFCIFLQSLLNWFGMQSFGIFNIMLRIVFYCTNI